ncbi:MAG: acetate--CoA ligase family protein [Gammaproteobacteria bacterium]|jgi:acetate---CoA ligase (ADP-forming)|nr:acetate--CoA ligase family protein [Gammaproteobacteria bacterium]MBT5203838.1 acetate--CoA ligase family protein [Gammaproteobacteria bacterium]MBT5603206.1 acetate--CoA ligase family protein [Gammaproteobacteria bacterium]MBT6245980.1 acetate--CoA ligase family protein [Gammaproteobacteria bacterium]MBT7243702.1 acetate--CoA ligase family protein [Flavobacteriaceae bacterium]
MPKDLSRLLNPKSIAIFGGSWAENVIKQLQKAAYPGKIWPVHPERPQILGLPCYASIRDLPEAPDASFIGVNKQLTISIVEQLSSRAAGGAVCFASGFLESEADVTGGAELQQELLLAAGDMPILGPNCYGLVNYLENIPIWPDEHGGVKVERGVAIIAQSSNIAISLTMQQRGLPVAFLATVGNQAQTDAANVAESLLTDQRISVVGFYLEGFGNIRSLERIADLAHKLGKPLLALKSGKTEASRSAALSHTASLTGSSIAGKALLKRLGIVEVDNLDVFIEALKILHFSGPLTSNCISSVSCSGGEAGLMADVGSDLNLDFASFSREQKQALTACLGPQVNIANPLDYHTYIWSDIAAMTACFTAVCSGTSALNIFIFDRPRNDHCDPSAWDCVLTSLLATKQATSAPIAVLSSITDNMSEALAHDLIDMGCIPLAGMRTGLKAAEAAVSAGLLLRRRALPDRLITTPQMQPEQLSAIKTINEHTAKQALNAYGLKSPDSITASNLKDLHQHISTVKYPCVLKAQGLAHKSENRAVIINIKNAETLLAEAEEMALRLSSDSHGFLVESMVSDVIAELLIGITRDPTGLMVLTLGFGGTSTELLGDSVSLLLPCQTDDIKGALSQLKLYPLLTGYRGAAKADIAAIVDAIKAVSSYAQDNALRLSELEVNPLLARTKDAIAADALLRLAPAPTVAGR